MDRFLLSRKNKIDPRNHTNQTRTRIHILNSIDRPATGASAADASLRIWVQGCFVVDRNFFAGFDVSQRYEEDVVVKDLHERVWGT